MGGGAFAAPLFTDELPMLLPPLAPMEDPALDETNMLPSLSLVTPVGVTGELLVALELPLLAAPEAPLGPPTLALVPGAFTPLDPPGEVRLGFLILGVVT